MLVCSCNYLTSFIIPLVGAWLLCLFVLVIALHPLLFPLVGALHIVLFSFVVALHITPLSPWRGVGGEASRGRCEASRSRCEADRAGNEG